MKKYQQFNKTYENVAKPLLIFNVINVADPANRIIRPKIPRLYYHLKNIAILSSKGLKTYNSVHIFDTET